MSKIGDLNLEEWSGESEIPYGRAEWPENLGNHRALVEVKENAEAVRVYIPWRRHDQEPGKKNIIVIDSVTGGRINNRVVVNLTPEFGDIIFQPHTVPGRYEIYYMPYQIVGKQYFPDTCYEPLQDTADTAWVAKWGLGKQDLAKGGWRHFPRAKVIEIQARGEFHGFYPMEIVATNGEIQEMLGKFPDRSYLLFPEDRRYPIRMRDAIPLRWLKQGPGEEFRGEALRGEFYVFQIGIYAVDELKDITVEIPDLVTSTGEKIPASNIRCFNLGGIDWLGKSFRKRLDIPAREVQALWFGVQVPLNVLPGEYHGNIKISPQNAPEASVKIKMEVSERILEDAGDSELGRLSRLRWLDSTIGLDDEVVEPYLPLEVQDSEVKCLGREVRFNDVGLPASIKSMFSSSVSRIEDRGREILAHPLSFIVETEKGRIAWSGGKFKLLKQTPGTVIWESESRGGPFILRCRAKMEFDGYINFYLTLTAGEDTRVKDISLQIPVKKEAAKYMMGMGCKGGYRPKEWKWQWDIERANNMLWLGDVNAGLHLKLKGKKEIWELFNLKSSGIPESWGNNGQGGCVVSEDGDSVLVRAYTGPRNIRKGEKLHFNFALLITPLKLLDKRHWNQRYYHNYDIKPSRWLKETEEAGGTIINIHHANELNPFINYPFLRTEKLSSFVEKAHAKGIKVKLYYTVRELSCYAVEMWALRSLGEEVFRDGPGFQLADPFADTEAEEPRTNTGHAWLCEHLISGYVPAWHQLLPDGTWDISIATAGLSRWHNYYLEGLAWLLKNVKIDGIYLDGIGYDREIMKRVRKVLSRERPGSLIDFHSGNTFRPEYGFNNCANQYMEHFPYIDSLWLGEMYNYDESPDYWLVEISGIPFGLFSEMLQGGGNPWRGMLYGMTNRLRWYGDPKNIWKVWDDFGIAEAEMVGYWSPDCPVKTDNKNVLATVYVKAGRALVALASWAKEKTEVRLTFDWNALKLHSQSAVLYAPEIPGFQPEARFRPEEKIPVEPGKGWLLIVREERQ